MVTNLFFNEELASGYKNTSQKIRVMSEAWALENMYCVHCGGPLSHCTANKPVADLKCVFCGDEFELKSTGGDFKKRIVDGAYKTLIAKIRSGNVPDFMYLHYSQEELKVENLLAIPSQFITGDLIIKRRGLSRRAQRKDWTGAIIDISSLPSAALIPIIKDGIAESPETVISKFCHTRFLLKVRGEARGWLLDIIKCINAIGNTMFTLENMYNFEPILQKKHPHNKYIKAKIRQQLQILRENGYLEFSGNGRYCLKMTDK